MHEHMAYANSAVLHVQAGLRHVYELSKSGSTDTDKSKQRLPLVLLQRGQLCLVALLEIALRGLLIPGMQHRLSLPAMRCREQESERVRAQSPSISLSKRTQQRRDVCQTS